MEQWPAIYEPLKCCHTPGCDGLMELLCPGGWYCRKCNHAGGQPTETDREYFEAGNRAPIPVDWEKR